MPAQTARMSADRAEDLLLPPVAVDVSIIVPVLNENANGQLDGLLAHLRSLCADGGGAAGIATGLPVPTAQATQTLQTAEVLLVDGGSTDGSLEVLQQWAEQHTETGATVAWTVLQSGRGRAVQMHTGALAARGRVLLFLHADTRLPHGAPALICHQLLARQKAWGRFDVLISGSPRALWLIARMMNLRSRLTGIATGDQAVFVIRSVYAQSGGFPQQPLMEDVALSRRLLRTAGRPLCLRQRALTSGRRWEQYGVWKTVWLMWRLRWLYWRGHSAEELAQLWRQ